MIIDNREHDLINFLDNDPHLHLGKDYLIDELLIGDVAISFDCVVEIKRVKPRPPNGKFEDYNDLWASLTDNRLYPQAKARHDNYKINIMLVEIQDGAEFFNRNFTDDHWVSIQITLATSFGTSIIMSSSMRETVDILLEIREKELQGEHYVSPYNKRPKATTWNEYKRNLLMGLINVGDERAISLLERFSSPMEIFSWILNTEVKFTKTGRPKQLKKDDPNYVAGFGPMFFLENKKLLNGDYNGT